MPGKGKHRRTRTSVITRRFAIAGTGGAALALPLIGATGAQAAQPLAAPSASVSASAESVAFAKQKSAETVTYQVVAGDCLSAIAAEHGVNGGWERLYADNRDAVGADPSLIRPGLTLTLGAKSAEAAPQQSARTEPAAEPVAETSAETSVEAVAEPAAPAEVTPASAVTPSGGYTTPLEGVSVSTAYRASGAMWSSGYHTGVDFSAAGGTPVRSIGPGTVVSAGWNGSYGNEVVIQHTDGTYSQYAHLSALSVSAGQGVSGGDEIGLVGSTGNSTGPHLHLEVRTGPGYGSDIDPVAYLQQKGVTL
ncbi:peptidoglycan DD-metalloendopeptidase family protein [Streptomyces sp. NPDC057638]|uniref:peptidoglycan DD-metalloendopeptidase family protein n=1 Tax=Streptomyces sp. NPDC057638 TaxID=3346190 RepID=UPI0036C4F82B